MTDAVEPVLIHTHIPKTGGVALYQLISANHQPDEVIQTETLEAVAPADLAVTENVQSRGALAWREYYSSLPRREKLGVRCFSGHQAPFLIDAIRDRPVHALCMLRDPVDRVVSLYLFMIWFVDHMPLPPTAPAVQILAAMRNRGWGLGDLYRELGGSGDHRAKLEELDELTLWALPLQFFNGQTRYILLTDTDSGEIPLDTDSTALRAYRDRASATLSETYVVGTQDRFSQSLRLFAESFGWQTLFEPRTNEGRLRGESREAEITPETLSLIRSYNQVDAQLHADYSDRLAELPAIGRLRDGVSPPTS